MRRSVMVFLQGLEAPLLTRGVRLVTRHGRLIARTDDIQNIFCRSALKTLVSVFWNRGMVTRVPRQALRRN